MFRISNNRNYKFVIAITFIVANMNREASVSETSLARYIQVDLHRNEMSKCCIEHHKGKLACTATT